MNCTMPTSEEAASQGLDSLKQDLRQLLESIDSDTPRVVVRYVDETRIVSESEHGYTVGPVSRVVITSLHDRQPKQTTFEGLSLLEANKVISEYPIDALYRNDNITR